ncbi:uncharacterized protein KD926_006055 [Aspergillus affinis]|uniref:uncharacterized protein n=1 Tax=Aspergillus affinis TaxID=1070780 RepID=UPI0022FE0F85|nr:uncharacterized protein KD926_006055 [Aspergillus affinis]KAI9042136.1 hypothetical protein KD926_006055 [Aspergillus affinis]
MAFAGLTGSALATARIFCIVVPAFLLFGYNQSNMGGVLDYDSFVKHFPAIGAVSTEGTTKATNARVQGTVTSIYTLGCLFGALGVAPIGNRLGRRQTLIIASAVATIGLVIQCTSFRLPQLIVGRILSGIGNGGVNTIVPVWQSECTKVKSRGKSVVIIGIFIATGIALAGWVNYGLSSSSDREIA